MNWLANHLHEYLYFDLAIQMMNMLLLAYIVFILIKIKAIMLKNVEKKD